jgi:hypothetical protein
MQEDLARLLLQLAGEEQPVIQLTPEEVASFAESRAQASPWGAGAGAAARLMCRNQEFRTSKSPPDPKGLFSFGI